MARRDKRRNCNRGRLSGGLPRIAIAMLAVLFPVALRAADCPRPREPRLPPAEAPVNNLGKHKDQLRQYHDGGNYDADVASVFADARSYVEGRADQVKRPAAVLDIDETSLSNWPSTKANDFGYIPGGACTLEPTLACGFDEWINKASAKATPGSVDFFKAAIAKNVAVFFITGRRHSQRQATLWNLDQAGFEGWAGVRTRPDDDNARSVVPFKSGERKKIQTAGYTIIANVGDQQSDLKGDEGGTYAECPFSFKVPNPFYFIP
jgi:HAD superfamily, subfamily IIIB (Acid phosphatase)